MIYLLLLLAAAPDERSLDALRAKTTGTVSLPAGRIEIHDELRLPDGAHDLTITGSNTTLHAAADFRGRAMLSCRHCRNLTIRNLKFDGNRPALERPLPLAPTDIPFSVFYGNNGLFIDECERFTMDHVEFGNIANFAVLVNRSREVSMAHLRVEKSGSRSAQGRNNTSGGVLLEQGTEDFTVADSTFRDIRGNGLWTHSCYQSPRNLRGKFARNEFAEIGRDAIQVGHSSDITVIENHGRRVGMRVEEVDVEHGGTPVGIDTAGNVDRSRYVNNRFEDVNGKCIDLDGFHDGVVSGNTCMNHGKLEDYPYGNFGISLNNTSIEMHSQNITIEGNTVDGMKFGAIFVVGSGHRIRKNTLRHLNMAHCNEMHAKVGCIVILAEPEFLESGIYLSSHAEKKDPARNITIEDNTISGWKMAQRCIGAGPGVSLSKDTIRRNRCSDE